MELRSADWNRIAAFNMAFGHSLKIEMQGLFQGI
jgi:hypothetical protein